MNLPYIKQAKDNPLLHTLVLSTLIVAGYYGLWNAYFTSDDFWMLGWVRFRETLKDAIWAEFGYGVRFLLDASLWVRVRLFDLEASPYYWVSLVQHIAVTCIVYGLVSFWTKRRLVALLSALLFGTTFAHYTVVTWITGSEYSQAAMLYLGTLAFWALYLRSGRIGWYLGSVVTFVMLLLFLEMVLSLPLVLLAYHLTLGLGDRKLRSLGWRDLRLHVPYWTLTALYLVLQFGFVHSGSSEAAVAAQTYKPGPHMISNLYYLVYLVVPSYGFDILARVLGPAAGPVFEWSTLALAVAGNLLAAYGLWKGSSLVRFALALVYLPFVPYTLWQGGFAGASRYRYLPAIGFSLLVALALVRLHAQLSKRHGTRFRLWVVPAVVAILLVANLGVAQVWVQRHVENSALRRAFVTDLATRYEGVEPGTRIFIEVPATKFGDLSEACELVFEQPVQCQAFVAGSLSLEDVASRGSAGSVYWLQATGEGIYQVFPPTAEAG